MLPSEPFMLQGLAAGEERNVKLGITVFDLSNPDEQTHENTLDVSYRYIGAYKVKVPAGSFDAVLMKWTFKGKVGPASVDDTQYRFFAPDMGIVAGIEQLDVWGLPHLQPPYEDCEGAGRQARCTEHRMESPSRVGSRLSGARSGGTCSSGSSPPRPSEPSWSSRRRRERGVRSVRAAGVPAPRGTAARRERPPGPRHHLLGGARPGFLPAQAHRRGACEERLGYGAARGLASFDE